MSKRYYYVQLREDFLNGDFVAYLLSLPDGKDYFIIFLFLMLATANTDGILCNQIGTVTIPYTPEMLAGKFRWFDPEKIGSALEVFQNAGFLLENNDGQLFIANFEDWIGSISQEGLRKREQRKRGQSEDNQRDKVRDNVPQSVPETIPDSVTKYNNYNIEKKTAYRNRYISDPVSDFKDIDPSDIPF